MSIADKAPPYSAEEVEKLARALVEHRGHGAFFSTDEARYCFERPLKKWGSAGAMKALEGGCVYLIGLFPEGWTMRSNERPKLEGDMLWLDASHARIVLGRCMEIESREIGDLRCSKTSTKKSLERVIVNEESLRRQALPQLRRRFSMPGGIN